MYTYVYMYIIYIYIYIYMFFKHKQWPTLEQKYDGHRPNAMPRLRTARASSPSNAIRHEKQKMLLKSERFTFY